MGVNDPLIPDWKVRQLIVNLRNRHYWLNNAKKKDPIHRTWTACYRYNRSKIYYRHGYKNRPRKRPDNMEWNYLVTQQKMKLSRRYDLHYQWRMVEYEQLEKMNYHNFPRHYNPSTLWIFVISRQIQKLKKQHKKKPKKQRNTLTWRNVIDRANVRLARNHNAEMRIKDSNWDLCIKANKHKLQTIHSKKKWDKTIYDNYLKLQRNNKDN